MPYYPICTTDAATCYMWSWQTEASLLVQMLSHRVQGLALMGLVFVILLVLLTAIQAAKHDWFIFNGTLAVSDIPLHLYSLHHAGSPSSTNANISHSTC